MSLHMDLAQCLLQRKYPGVSEEDTEILLRAHWQRDEETLHERLPSIIRNALEEDLERYYEK